MDTADTLNIPTAFDNMPAAREGLEEFVKRMRQEGWHGEWEGAVYRMKHETEECLVGIVVTYSIRLLQVRR